MAAKSCCGVLSKAFHLPPAIVSTKRSLTVVVVVAVVVVVLKVLLHTHTDKNTHTHTHTHAAQINCCCFRRLFVFEICFLNVSAALSLVLVAWSLDQRHGPPLGHLICCSFCCCYCCCRYRCFVCLLPICYLNLICIT